MRVLQVIDDMGLNSGVSSMLLNYYRYIDHDKVNFDFMVYNTVSDDVKEYCKRNHSRIYEVGPLSGKTVLDGTLYKKVEGVMKRYAKKYDVIHGHESNTAFIYMKLAKKYGINHRIIHSHNAKGADGMVKKVRNFILNHYGLKYVTDYCACSKKAAKYLYGTTNHVNIINNAIDINKFQFRQEVRNRMRKKLGVEDMFVVGHVGRFAPQKNHEYIIDVFWQFHQKVQNSKLVLIGDGELMDVIKQKVHVLHLHDAVLFEGVQNNVHEYMQAMDVFVLPSMYEGLPVVCVEAQAAGLTCVVSKEVTREIKITKNVKFIGIDNKCPVLRSAVQSNQKNQKDINDWVQELIKIREKKNVDSRKLCADKVAKKGFDIREQSKRLENYYIKLSNHMKC